MTVSSVLALVLAVSGPDDPAALREGTVDPAVMPVASPHQAWHLPHYPGMPSLPRIPRVPRVPRAP